MTCSCRKGGKCLNCMERDGLTTLLDAERREFAIENEMIRRDREAPFPGCAVCGYWDESERCVCFESQTGMA